VAVYDSVPYPTEEEGKSTTVFGWVPIGGTSVASPIIASIFALTGGAHGVEYPAKTLYSHLGSASLYDVTEGGNGECDGIYTSGCKGSMSPLSPLDCGQRVLICNAAPGYDGPTGVGTPNGIAAFQPPIEEGKKQTKAEEEKKSKEAEAEKSKKKTEEEEAKRKEEEAAAKNPGGDSTTGTSTTGAGSISPANGASGGSSSGTTASSSTASAVTGQPTIRLSAFALTPSALTALRSARPKVSYVGFAFTLSAAARVRATLAKLVGVRGREQWVLVPGSVTFIAAKGHHRRHLTSRDGLTPGSYRLTLTPQHGSAQSIVFQVG
jgi:hypothetical protein